MATCNGAEFVGEQLASLLRQTHAPTELIIADDDSEDTTIRIVQKFVESAPFPVRLIQRERRLGYADNFLAAALTATGDVVSFCDQDDDWDETKLGLLAELFEREPCIDLVAHYARVVDVGGRPLGRSYPAEKRPGRYRGPALPMTHHPGLTLACRRRLLTRADWRLRPKTQIRAGVPMGHDEWIWLLAASTAETVVIPDELVSYRQHRNLFGDDHVSMIKLLQRAFATGPDAFEVRADNCEDRMSYLRHLGSEWACQGHATWSAQAWVRADAYQRIRDESRGRAALFRSKGRRASLRQWARLLRDGVYRRRHGAAVGVGAGAKDFLLGVILPPRER